MKYIEKNKVETYSVRNKEDKKVEKKEKKKEVKVPTELELAVVRQTELLSMYEWMKTNDIKDVSKLEVVLGQVNQRILELQ